MQVTGWSRGLEVTGGGQGVVSHAGLALLRHLADKTGLAGGLSRALATPRILVHDRGRVLADLACAIGDGARVISDFRVMADQQELFGLVSSVRTVWRTLQEIARAGSVADGRIIAAVNMARRHAWAQAAARHGALPGVRLADKTLDGVTCIRLDATVVPAHSDKELAEANFKGYGHHPLLAECDNTGEPLAWMLRRGSAGSNTAADHVALVDAAICALPPGFRRKLMITCDGAGASHHLVAHLDKLGSRRERPHPGAQLTLFEAEDGWRYSLWVTNRDADTRGWLGQTAYLDAAHRVHARVEDVIRTGKDCGLGHFPSHDFKINAAWLTASMTAQIQLAWLKLLALDGDLAKAEPKTLRYRVLHAAARLVRGGAATP